MSYCLGLRKKNCLEGFRSVYWLAESACGDLGSFYPQNLKGNFEYFPLAGKMMLSQNEAAWTLNWQLLQEHSVYEVGLTMVEYVFVVINRL